MGIPQDENAERIIRVIVMNTCLYPNPPAKVEVVAKASDKLSTVRGLIADKLGYAPGCFDITVHGGKKISPESELEEETLGKFVSTDKTIVTASKNPNAKDTDFGVDNKKIHAPSGKIAEMRISSPPSQNQSYAGGAGHQTSTAIVPYGPPAAGVAAGGSHWSSSSGSKPSSWSTYNDWTLKSPSGYVGLSNQGATCYLNSLIQSLYMTPEFRYAVYNWDFEATYQKRRKDNEEKDKNQMEIDKPSVEQSAQSTAQTPEDLKKQFEKESIPRQLQLLFARLQMRDQRAVKTTALTNSFGWKESDAFTQHDVQELCRVLFDALEKVFKGTKQENLINELYQGEMKDYVKCKECLHESSRTDKYLDVPLVIRGFGSVTPVKSVEEALQRFIQPELLEGDNQYKCDRCAKNVDAVKGLKFVSFPRILTLQLKRFDFDYDTLRRVKLNDRVSFPMLLDMNQFLDADNMEGVNLVGDTKPFKRKRPEDESKSENTNGKDEEEDDEWQEAVQKALANGPYVYELYAVLIHRGSALGGHYYAYIKAFDKHKWYEFNDSSVHEINVDEIEKSFGEEVDERYKKGMMSYFYSSANAYMLMYRKIDPSMNRNTVTDQEIPEQLRKALQDEVEKHKRKQEDKEREREMVSLKIHFEMAERSIKVHNSTTLEETVRQCADAFGVTGKYPPDCIRIRNYHSYNDVPAEPYDNPEQMKKTLDELHFYSSKTVMLETKMPGDKFPEYNPSEMLIRVIKHDPETNKFQPAQMIFIHRDATLGDLKKLLASKFGIPTKFQRIVRESQSYMGPAAKILHGVDGSSLRHENKIWEASKIYLEYSTDPLNEEAESPSFAEIERTKNMIEIKFNSVGKEEADHTLQVSKKITFKELKELMQPLVGAPLDEFKVSRGTAHWRVELKNDSESLEDCRLSDGNKLIVEKGRPLKEGETKINFVLFDPENKRSKETCEDLFELNVEERIRLPELKEILAKKVQEEKNYIIDPEKIRLREMFSKTPGKVLKGIGPLKDAVNVLYNGKILGIQELSGEELAKTEDDVTFFVQQWLPSKFETSAQTEYTLSENMSILDFKKMISEKYNIQNVGIAKGTGLWPGPDILDIPNLDWDRQVPDYVSTIKVGLLGTVPLYLRDGDVLLFRDNDEPLKELTKEEKRKLEKDAQSKRRTGNYYGKEEALTINARV